MKRFAIIIFTSLFLLIAFASKPSDKQCIIDGVKAVWGSYVPDQKLPMYYEEFMNVTSKQVVINNWIFLKRIRYKYKDKTRTIGIGAFNNVFTF